MATVEQPRLAPLRRSASEVINQISVSGRAGARTVYFQVLDLHDLDHLRLLAAYVRVQLEGPSIPAPASR